MSVTVELGLSKAFTLDDPVAGVIGNDEFVIGGVSFEDVTSRVRSVQISRGKNRDLDRFNAGGLSVTFNNQDRAFDPLYSASPFAGNIVPRRDVRVTEQTGVVATGGVVSDIVAGGVSYRVHTFSAVGTATFTIDRPSVVDYLIVGGGGGGGVDRGSGGGGGAGGLFVGTQLLNAGSSSVVVGAGGLGFVGSGTNSGNGASGGLSSAFGFSASGGGGGGSRNTAQNGGSGGGAGNGSRNSTTALGGNGVAGQGFNGGSAFQGSTARQNASGGGGGASQLGGSAPDGGPGGKGGDGIAADITGTSVTYAGGGGGGARDLATAAGLGGAGGGGAGGFATSTGDDGGTGPGANGVNGLGGGGGGAGQRGTGTKGGDGGSGVVIIRYPLVVPQYVGKITDWNLGYDPSGQSLAELQASDALTFLAQQVLTPGTATVQASGARVNAVLDMPTVEWPSGDRDIDTGASILGDDVFEGNVLTYLQKVELSEGGLFFIDKAGRVAFKDRLATPTVDNVTVFADDGTGIPFAPAAVEYGTEQLFNQVIVTSPQATATANAALSQTRYGILERQIDTLLDDTDQVPDYADFLVGRYAEPEYRFAQLSVDISNLTSGQRSSMYSLDMGSVIQVKFTPNGIGSAIERYGLVISIGHDISPDDHIMTVGVGSLQTSLFVIGDPEFGTIGEGAPGVLGF